MAEEMAADHPDVEQLVDQARAIRKQAYAPYSDYTVGAAIQTRDGTIYAGHNVEYVTFTNTAHAEQMALMQAVKDGYRDPEDFNALIVTSGKREETPAGEPPCGVCRQSLKEFCGSDLTVLVDTGEHVERYTLDELLPDGMENTAVLTE